MQNKAVPTTCGQWQEGLLAEYSCARQRSKFGGAGMRQQHVQLACFQHTTAGDAPLIRCNIGQSVD